MFGLETACFDGTLRCGIWRWREIPVQKTHLRIWRKNNNTVYTLK